MNSRVTIALSLLAQPDPVPAGCKDQQEFLSRCVARACDVVNALVILRRFEGRTIAINPEARYVVEEVTRHEIVARDPNTRRQKVLRIEIRQIPKLSQLLTSAETTR